VKKRSAKMLKESFIERDDEVLNQREVNN